MEKETKKDYSIMSLNDRYDSYTHRIKQGNLYAVSSGRTNMIDWVFMLVLGTLTILAITLPLRARNHWHGNWKHVATLPFIALALIVFNIIVGITLDPSSHNLFPFEILLWSLGSLGFIGICSLIRYFQSPHSIHS